MTEPHRSSSNIALLHHFWVEMGGGGEMSTEDSLVMAGMVAHKVCNWVEMGRRGGEVTTEDSLVKAGMVEQTVFSWVEMGKGGCDHWR